MDGFWLPQELRRSIKHFETYYLKGGMILDQPQPGAAAIRWPRLDQDEWQALLAGLQAGRRLETRSFLARWEGAFMKCLPQMMEQLPDFLPILAACTGYSAGMMMQAFQAGDLIQTQEISRMLDFNPSTAASGAWSGLPSDGTNGYSPQQSSLLRFYPKHRQWFHSSAPLYRPAPHSELVLGFAAGNVPGTAFLLALLGGLANAAQSLPAPAVLIRNSRHEPLFAPWLLSLIEQVDPELVSPLAVLLWDYEDTALQARLMKAAGLMIAAAGDDTIAALDAARQASAPGLRFHRHGHKVSFSVISREFSSQQTVAAAAASAALDSSMWDQNGCLSARVHFVEGDANAYAAGLAAAMRGLAEEAPRGATPRRFIHRAFDTYHALQDTGKVHVLTSYEDDCVVVLDLRPWDAEAFRRGVNACQGRVTIVRPVRDVLDVPDILRSIPMDNLQTVGLACDAARILPFAEKAGAAGVTSIRRLGKAAFPQLAYSWDGYLPLDSACTRPDGHWTAVEGLV